MPTHLLYTVYTLTPPTVTSAGQLSYVLLCHSQIKHLKNVKISDLAEPHFNIYLKQCEKMYIKLYLYQRTVYAWLNLPV